MLPNELSGPPPIPGSARLHREVCKAIDYARMVASASPGSDTPKELRRYLRAAALLLPAAPKEQK